MAPDSHDLSRESLPQEQQSQQFTVGSGGGGGGGWLPLGFLFGKSTKEEELHEPSPVVSLSASSMQGASKQQRISKGWRQFFRLEANEHSNSDDNSEHSSFEVNEDVASQVGDPEPPALGHPSCEFSDIRLEINDIHEAIKNHDLWVHDAAAMRHDIDDLRSSIWEHEDWMENVFGVVKQMQAKEDFLSKRSNELAKELADLRRQVGFGKSVTDDLGLDAIAESACVMPLRSQADAQSENSTTVTERSTSNLMTHAAAVGEAFGHSELAAQGLSYPVDKQLIRGLRHLRTSVTAIEGSILRCQAEGSAINYPITPFGASTSVLSGLASLDATIGLLRNTVDDIELRICDKCVEVENMVVQLQAEFAALHREHHKQTAATGVFALAKGNNSHVTRSRSLTSLQEMIATDVCLASRTDASNVIDAVQADSKHSFNPAQAKNAKAKLHDENRVGFTQAFPALALQSDSKRLAHDFAVSTLTDSNKLACSRRRVKNHDSWVLDTSSIRQDIDDLFSTLWEHEGWMVNVSGVVRQMQANEECLGKEIADFWQQLGPEKGVVRDSFPGLNSNPAVPCSLQNLPQLEAQVEDDRAASEGLGTTSVDIEENIGTRDNASEVQRLVCAMNNQLNSGLRHLKAMLTVVEGSLLRLDQRQADVSFNSCAIATHGVPTSAVSGFNSLDAGMGALRSTVHPSEQKMFDKSAEAKGSIVIDADKCDSKRASSAPAVARISLQRDEQPASYSGQMKSIR